MSDQLARKDTAMMDAMQDGAGSVRSTMQLLAQAVKNRWVIPPEMRDAAGKLARHIAVHGKTDRDRLRAVELLAALDRDNIAALLALDKVERLEGGNATERIELAPIVFERRD